MVKKSGPDYIADHQVAFFELLETKTGWGKEDVKKIYKEATQKVLMDRIREVEEQQ